MAEIRCLSEKGMNEDEKYHSETWHSIYHLAVLIRNDVTYIHMRDKMHF